jgi:hypothetical protein
MLNEASVVTILNASGLFAMPCPQSHAGTKALNSGVRGGAPGLSHQVSMRSQPVGGLSGRDRIHGLPTHPGILSHRAGVLESHESPRQFAKAAGIVVRKCTQKIVARYSFIPQASL